MNITLLCPDHHREKTKGLLPIEDIRRANLNPKNKTLGTSLPLKLHYGGERFSIRLGKTYFDTDQLKDGHWMIPLVMDGYPIIAIHYEDDQILLDLRLFDDQFRQVLVIIRNELVFSSDNWDITFEGKTLVLYQKQRDILMVMHLNAPSELWIERANFHVGSKRFIVTADFWKYNQATVSVGRVLAQVGIVIGHANADSPMKGDFPSAVRMG
ncbi:MAG: hypothetical protein JNJ91_12015 [Flavobacteriales bacterium]|nr:hypothetical protein [Flavobacteriales bacterium]